MFGNMTERYRPMVGALALVAIMAAGSVVAQDKILVVGASVYPESLGTALPSFAALSLMYQTMDPLVTRDDNAQVHPALAERWEQINDTTTRFHLRRGVKFHDGAPFSAADVKFTLDYVFDKKTVYSRKRRITQITSVNIVDDHTVDIVTKKPFPTLVRGLTDIPIEPKHYVEKMSRKGMNKHPIGTGPFKYDTWAPGDHYEVVANKDYWNGAPKVGRVVIRQIPEGVTRVASLLAGETHIIEEVPVNLIPKVEASNGIAIAAVESTVGIKHAVNFVEGGVFSKMVKAHDMGPIQMVGWYSLGDADFASVWFTEESPRAYWKNGEYKRLFVEGRSTVDEKMRLAAYHRMMEILNDEVPAVWMFGLPSAYGKSAGLSGWSPASDNILRLSKAALS